VIGYALAFLAGVMTTVGVLVLLVVINIYQNGTKK
jgi:hypothetical protein